MGIHTTVRKPRLRGADDLRFLFRTRFDVGRLFGNLRTLENR